MSPLGVNLIQSPHRQGGRYLKMPLKRPSSIPSDGEARSVSEKGWKGCLGGVWVAIAWCYAASILGSILTCLRRASRLKF
jgi:hypothetical protein